jgi:hypothetical protein
MRSLGLTPGAAVDYLGSKDIRWSGGCLDPEKRRALCSFYREEFERHIDHLFAGGFIGHETRVQVDPACRRFLARLDRVCWHSEFPAMAEVMLRSLECLSQLDKIDPRQAH